MKAEVIDRWIVWSLIVAGAIKGVCWLFGLNCPFVILLVFGIAVSFQISKKIDWYEYWHEWDDDPTRLTIISLYIWGGAGTVISPYLAYRLGGLHSFVDFMTGESWFFGVNNLTTWSLSGFAIGIILAAFLNLDTWKKHAEASRRDAELTGAPGVSVFNAIMQLLGCVIGTYLAHKTHEPLAFVLAYVPFSIGGMLLKDL